jgi:haloalkane dehalogenase
MSTLPVVTDILRTPEARFAALPDFPYAPNYTTVGGLRIADIDEGPRDGPGVLGFQRAPTRSFLLRNIIPVLVAAGCRAIAPDLVGFGRSDKPARAGDYSYRHQVWWLNAWLEARDLRGITLFCQDWGSLIGLRMVADAPERFARVVLANGGLPTGTGPVPRAFRLWRAFARHSPWFPIGRIVKAGCAAGLRPTRWPPTTRLSPTPAIGSRRGVPGLRADHPRRSRARQHERAWAVQALGQALPDPVQHP